MTWLSSAKAPLLLHLLIETPAALSFLLHPQAQLPGASDDAKLILRSYGGLLLSTNLVCLTLLLDGTTSTTMAARITLCLGLYHAWPIYRAVSRIRRYGRVASGPPKEKGAVTVLGGPALHFVVHVVCLVALVGGGLVGMDRI
ncbi:hypothetical protein B0T17DRAFT_170608 [Bombardia bombarda]|uniref:Uncharacterized protein n=1 Tax=Bombardia bombarda TaxID=252184 RepID=A0AA39X7T7_9PEZI|nr:hypothetical protein B0T17DRAFT_170608 [Bombardia bombarda]